MPLLPNFAKTLRLNNIKMFEEFITSIKKRFNKTSHDVPDNVDYEKSGYKRKIYLFKKKLNKSDALTLSINNYYDNSALSPRALGTGEFAETEIAWPVVIDTNPNILDKFTKIITRTNNNSHYDKVW